MKEILRTAEGRILRRFPHVCKGGFYKAIRKIIRGEVEERFTDGGSKKCSARQKRKKEADEECEELWRDCLVPGFYPDLYEIDHENRMIRIFEIEDTHPLKDAKLRRLVLWWFSVDNNLEFDVELRVYDRYGMNERKLSLPNLYFELFLGAPPGSAAAEEVAREAGIKLDDDF